MTRKYLIAGNWKMNVTSSDSVDLISEINTLVGQQTQVQVCICPPPRWKGVRSCRTKRSASWCPNMSAEPSGAFTARFC